MGMIRKANVVVGIGEERTLKDKNLEGFAIFHDNFISKSDGILYDEKGEEYRVLDFIEVEKLKIATTPDMFPKAYQYYNRCSCVKLDKPFSIGAIFYNAPTRSYDEGDVEIGVCNSCGAKGAIKRKYYHYGILCDCHGPEHFEIVFHCKNCIPAEPKTTIITLSTEKLKKLIDGSNR